MSQAKHIIAVFLFFFQMSKQQVMLSFYECFHVLAIVNSAAMVFGVCVSFQIRVLIFSRYISRSEDSGSYGNSIL